MTTNKYLNRVTQTLAAGDPSLLRDAARCVLHLSEDWSSAAEVMRWIERIERAAGVFKKGDEDD